MKGLGLIASHCGPSLRTLRLADVDSLPQSIQAIAHICQSCPYLVVFDIDNGPSHDCGDEAILAAVRYCPLIEVLPTHSLYLTDVAMNALATIHTLRELKLSYSSACTSTGIQRVLHSNHANLALVSLEFTEVNDALVRCIGNHCRNLKSLNLNTRRSPALGFNVLQDLFRGCPLLEVQLRPLSEDPTATLRAMFEHCHNLVELDLSVAIPVDAPLVDTEPVLYAYYPSLTKLKITSWNFTASVLVDVFTYCTNLTHVNIDSCSHATDEVINALAQNCSSLNTLEITRCSNMTIIGLLGVATHCSSLTSLTLTYMPISDEVLIQLSLHCKDLKRLSMYQWGEGESITETGVMAVLEGCTGLSFLGIRGKMVKSTLATLDLTKLGQLYPHIKLDIVR